MRAKFAINFAIAVSCAVLLWLPSVAVSADFITISNATYGVDPDHQIDATAKVTALCQGKLTCEFEVTNEFFGGDPWEGHPKHVSIVWACGAISHNDDFPKAPNDPYAILSCP